MKLIKNNILISFTFLSLFLSIKCFNIQSERSKLFRGPEFLTSGAHGAYFGYSVGLSSSGISQVRFVLFITNRFLFR